jgi:hypothetical protein
LQTFAVFTTAQDMAHKTKQENVSKKERPAAPKKLITKFEKTQTDAQKAYIAYEAKSLEYEEMLKKGGDKVSLFQAEYAAKKAKYEYKIKALDSKMSKFQLKRAEKALRKEKDRKE